MPDTKAGRVAQALNRLEQMTRARPPRIGMFSTMDELIQTAPFEKAPAEQWANYLKPGRSFQREGVNFSLNKEESDILRKLIEEGQFQGATLEREELRQLLTNNRPMFRPFVGHDDFEWASQMLGTPEEQRHIPMSQTAGMGPTRWGRYGGGRLHHQSPRIDPEQSYEENVTGMLGLHHPQSHFGNDTLSWSRTSILPTSNPQGEGTTARLIEEIQSDLHQAGRDRGYQGDPLLARNQEDMERDVEQLPAFMTHGWDRDVNEVYRLYARDPQGIVHSLSAGNNPETVADFLEIYLRQNPNFFLNQEGRAQELLNDLRARNVDVFAQEDIPRYPYINRIPRAPFAGTENYGRLELKKQLLNAVEDGQEYLALTRGSDQAERYGMRPDDPRAKGTSEVYDKIYLKELKKLAKQYGAEVVDLPITVRGTTDNRIAELREVDAESVADYMDMSLEGVLDDLQGGDLSGDYTWPIESVHGQLLEAIREMPLSEGRARNLERQSEIINRIVNERYRPAVQEYSEFLDHFGDESRRSAARTESQAQVLEQNIADIWADLTEELGNLEILNHNLRKDHTVTEKTFPAIHITPEVREKVLKAGVPLFAEGGQVDGGLQRLKRAAEFLPDTAGSLGFYNAAGALENLIRRQLGYNEISPEATQERDKRLLSLAAEGLASQWYGEGDEGQPEFALSPENIGNVRPGLVQETLAIPTLGEIVGAESPEFASEAAASQERLREMIQQQMGVEPPQGFAENLAESAGIMAGQVPIPGAWLKQLKRVVPEGAGMMERLGELSKRAGLAPVEWLSPIIDPKLSNYAIGSVFGGTIGSLLEEDAQSAGYESFEDLYNAAQSGDEEATALLMQLMEEELKRRSEQPEPEMAGGGKVDLTRRALLKGAAALGAGAAGTGKIAKRVLGEEGLPAGKFRMFTRSFDPSKMSPNLMKLVYDNLGGHFDNMNDMDVLEAGYSYSDSGRGMGEASDWLHDTMAGNRTVPLTNQGYRAIRDSLEEILNDADHLDPEDFTEVYEDFNPSVYEELKRNLEGSQADEDALSKWNESVVRPEPSVTFDPEQISPELRDELGEWLADYEDRLSDFELEDALNAGPILQGGEDLATFFSDVGAPEHFTPRAKEALAEALDEMLTFTEFPSGNPIESRDREYLQELLSTLQQDLEQRRSASDIVERLSHLDYLSSYNEGAWSKATLEQMKNEREQLLRQLAGFQMKPEMAEGGKVGRFRDIMDKFGDYFTVDELEAPGMTPNQYDAVRDPEYMARAKGINVDIEEMTPQRYIDEAAKILSILEGRVITPDDLRAERSRNQNYLEDMKQAMMEKTFAAPHLDYARQGQEGLHRAISAEQLGFDTIPVVTLRKAEEGMAKGGKVGRVVKISPKFLQELWALEGDTVDPQHSTPGHIALARDLEEQADLLRAQKRVRLKLSEEAIQYLNEHAFDNMEDIFRDKGDDAFLKTSQRLRELLRAQQEAAAPTPKPEANKEAAPKKTVKPQITITDKGKLDLGVPGYQKGRNAVTSVPDSSEGAAVMFSSPKGDQGLLARHSDGKYYMDINNRYDKGFDTLEEVVKFLNSEGWEYGGIEDL